MRLLGYGVLICKYVVCRRAGVDGGYDREVILKFEEMVGRRGKGAVEGIEKRGIEGPE